MTTTASVPERELAAHPLTTREEACDTHFRGERLQSQPAQGTAHSGQGSRGDLTPIGPIEKQHAAQIRSSRDARQESSRRKHAFFMHLCNPTQGP